MRREARLALAGTQEPDIVSGVFGALRAHITASESLHSPLPTIPA